MPLNPEVYRSASVMVEHYGAQAEVEAAALARSMCERGDLDGERVWLEIVRAIVELQRQEHVEAVG